MENQPRFQLSNRNLGYTDADRRIIRLTRADFDTEADFLKWKAWSDENYHTEEKGDHVEENHTAPMDEKTGAPAIRIRTFSDSSILFRFSMIIFRTPVTPLLCR